MAKNLRAKIPTSDLLSIHDVNEAATKKFAEEVGIAASNTSAPEKGTGIHIAKDPREVAELSVSLLTLLRSSLMLRDDTIFLSNDLSWEMLLWDISLI